jgi:hypothetical protein
MEEKLKDIENITKQLKHVINLENNREKDNNKKIMELYPDLKLLRLLGSGSFGSVFECYEPKSKTSKALKKM